MSSIKKYNFEKYSVFDIQDFLERLGYKVKKKYYRQRDRMFILDTDISMDFPCIDAQGPDAYVRFENYPRTKNYESSKKLFDKISRKFSIKMGENIPKKIKDIDKMEIIDWTKGGKRIKGSEYIN